MTGDDERGRRIRERDVGFFIKRATELQQTELVERERRGGVSLLDRCAKHIAETAVAPSSALPGHADRGTGITGRA